MKLLVINGPNLNFLGIREKGIYGTQNYQNLVDMIQDKASASGCEIECFQSNHEGAIIQSNERHTGSNFKQTGFYGMQSSGKRKSRIK